MAVEVAAEVAAAVTSVEFTVEVAVEVAAVASAVKPIPAMHPSTAPTTLSCSSSVKVGNERMKPSRDDAAGPKGPSYKAAEKRSRNMEPGEIVRTREGFK